jgi:hypothetical protein
MEEREKNNFFVEMRLRFFFLSRFLTLFAIYRSYNSSVEKNIFSLCIEKALNVFNVKHFSLLSAVVDFIKKILESQFMTIEVVFAQMVKHQFCKNKV